MKKVLNTLGIVSFLIFLLLLLSYKSQTIEKFDEWMKELFFGNDFIIFFHYFGELKIVSIICLILIILFSVKGKYREIFLITMSTGIGFLINQIIKNLVKRARPDIPNQLSTFSFPSAHAMVSLLYILPICYLMINKIQSQKMKYFIWIVGIALFILVGLSRVAESRHFASDVLAGWSLGFTWFLICLYFYKKL